MISDYILNWSPKINVPEGYEIVTVPIDLREVMHCYDGDMEYHLLVSIINRLIATISEEYNILGSEEYNFGQLYNHKSIRIVNMRNIAPNIDHKTGFDLLVIAEKKSDNQRYCECVDYCFKN